MAENFVMMSRIVNEKVSRHIVKMERDSTRYWRKKGKYFKGYQARDEIKSE